MRVDFFNSLTLLLFAKKLFLGAAFGWALCFIPTLITIGIQAFAFFKIRSLDKKLQAELKNLEKEMKTSKIPFKQYN